MTDFWVKLYDSFWDSSVTDCGINATILALWLISHARRTDGWYKGYKIPRGAVAYSERELAEQLSSPKQKITRAELRWARRLLEKVGFITQHTTHRFIIAYIRNYNQYQPSKHPTHRPPTTHQHPIPPETYRRKKEDNIVEESKKADKEFGRLVKEGKVLPT